MSAALYVAHSVGDPMSTHRKKNPLIKNSTTTAPTIIVTGQSSSRSRSDPKPGARAAAGRAGARGAGAAAGPR